MNLNIRSPNGINVHRFLEGYGVKVRPYREGRNWRDRPANVVYGGRTIARLMRIDMDRVALVVRCIQASNARCLDDFSVLAVWQFVGAHCASMPSKDLINAFGLVDLARIRERGQQLARGQFGRMGKTAEKISTLLADALIPEEDAA